MTNTEARALADNEQYQKFTKLAARDGKCIWRVFPRSRTEYNFVCLEAWYVRGRFLIVQPFDGGGIHVYSDDTYPGSWDLVARWLAMGIPERLGK